MGDTAVEDTGERADMANHGDTVELEARLERYRVELTGYCYRMLGSSFDAQDAVQETMVRAWRGFDRFEGRSSLRSWLYRIAINVCFDLLDGRKRRALPMDMGAPAVSVRAAAAGTPLPERTWVEPIPDANVVPADGDPAERVVARESVRLAFVAALQHLPPRQRATLILRDVLRWRAAEVAVLLGTTVASVNSALQRARETLAATDLTTARPSAEPAGDEEQQLLARYVDAFERYDIDSLVSLLHEDATQSMPPYPMWMRGADKIGEWLVGPGIECRGSRLLPAQANGAPAFAQYRPSGPGGRHEPWSIHVLDVVNGRVAGITFFLDTTLFPMFGLPEHPDG